MGQSYKIGAFLWIAAISIQASINLTNAEGTFGPKPKEIKAADDAGVYHAIFRNIGKYAAHTTDINIRIPFQFYVLQSNFVFQQEKINEFERKNSYYEKDFKLINDIHR